MVPHLHVKDLLLRFVNKKVNRLIVVHPSAVQYIDHNPTDSEICIRYVSGERMCIKDAEKPEYITNLFENIVSQIKESSSK